MFSLKVKFTSLLILSSLLSINLQALERANLISCVVNIVCEYTPRVSTSSRIVSRIKQRNPFIYKLREEEGYVKKDGATNIILKFSNNEQLNIVLKEILILDRFEVLNNTKSINLELKIYEMNENAFREFNFQADLKKKDPSRSGVPEVIGNLVSSILKIGNIDIFSIFSMKKIVENSTRVFSKKFSVKNNGVIKVDERKKYITQTNITNIEWRAGVMLDGNAEITKDFQNKEFIQLSNLKLFYGKPIFKTAENIEILTIDETNEPIDGVINLKKGETIVLTSVRDSFEISNSNRQLLGAGKNSNKSVKYRIITISAPKKIVEVATLYQKFDKESIALMPNSSIPLKEVLHSLSFDKIKILTNGSRRITIRLDKELASLKNIKKDVEIIVTGDIKVKRTLKVENLMLTGFHLPEIPTSKLSKNKIKIKIKLRSVKNRRIKYVHKYIYNPLNNEFFE